LKKSSLLFTFVEAAGGWYIINPGKYWYFPSRKMGLGNELKKGEFYKQTALREVQEECGLKHIEAGKHLLILTIFILKRNKNIKMYDLV